MKGLLYKDFIASNSKWHVILLTTYTLILGIIAFLVPDGTQPEVICAFTVAITITIYFLYYFALSMPIVASLFKGDTGKNCMLYLLCLPVSKKDYVAARYLFLFIANYILLSLGAFWSMILSTVCITEDMAMVAQFPSMFGPSMVCIGLFVASFELPVFILFGKKKGDFVINAFIISLFIVFSIYLLFGNINILENIDIIMVMKYLQEHVEITVLLDTLGPILTFLLYYGSYRFTIGQFSKKEEWDYE